MGSRLKDSSKQTACAITPRRLPDPPRKAILELIAADSLLAAVIERVGPPELPGKPANFPAFARAIMGQQLSVHVAGIIYQKFSDALQQFGGVSPEAVLSAPDEVLRSAGLSAAKARTVKALAEAWLHHGWSEEGFAALADEEIIQQVTTVKGIGPWTVKMVLIFCLRRPNVLPVEDLGLRMGIRKVYALEALPTVSEMNRIAAHWAPWRTLGTWYCWQSLKLKD